MQATFIQALMARAVVGAPALLALARAVTRPRPPLPLASILFSVISNT